MQICSINSINYNVLSSKMNYRFQRSINFSSNSINLDTDELILKSKIKPDIFFIRMETYARNDLWANEMAKLCTDVTRLVENKSSFGEIIDKTSNGIYKINRKNISENQKKDMSIFNQRYNPLEDKYLNKAVSKYGRVKEDCSSSPYILFPNGRGMEYYKKYKNKCLEDKQENIINPCANEEYSDALTCIIKYYDSSRKIKITYGGVTKDAGQNLKIASRAYEKLINNKTPTLKDIIETSATIQWLIAQATPFESGSDSIANIISKAILNAYNVKLSPIKKGKSFDFEAFYRNLDDYIQIYPSLFEEPLEFNCK